MKKAFTLIELLVVIAIIAILAAILFPVFAQAKLAAKKTVALSNAKQAALAEQIYMSDVDDQLTKSYYGFPDACNWGNGNTTYYNWRYALNPYTKSSELLRDPTNPFKDKQYDTQAYDDGTGKTTAPNHVNLPMNFAVNGNIIGFANGNCAGLPSGLGSTTSLEDVAGTIMLVPSRIKYHDIRLFFLSPKWDNYNDWCLDGSGGSKICPAAGNGGVHAVGKQAAFVWADGHAKSMNVLATLQTNNPSFDNWYGYAGDQAGGTKYTQADRQDIAKNAYPEYK